MARSWPRIPQTMVSSLPQELVDAIIDHVDTSTLKRTSAVSHAFLVPSHRRLFRSLTFRITHRNAPKFIHTRRLLGILSSNRSLARHIRDLTLILHDSSSAIQDPYLPKLLRSLTSLRSFTFEYDPLSSSSSSDSASPLSMVRTVLERSPTLHTARFVKLCPCTFDLSQITHLAPQLRHLEFRGQYHAIKCTHDAAPLLWGAETKGQGDSASARIQTLSIGGLGVTGFVDSLLVTSPPATFSRLRELKISGWRHDVFPAAWEVMKLAQETLESVVFYWPYGRSYKPSLRDPLGPIDLTSLPSLHTVVFHVPHVWANGDPTCLWFPWVYSILTPTHLPPHLVHLGLILDIDFDDEWEPGLVGTGRSIVEMGLDRVLDETLKRERYPDLKRVEVRLLVRDDGEGEICKGEVEKGKARQWFPALDARGLLTVSVGAMEEDQF